MPGSSIAINGEVAICRPIRPVDRLRKRAGAGHPSAEGSQDREEKSDASVEDGLLGMLVTTTS